MAAQRRKNQLFHSLQFLFSHPVGLATFLHPVQGYLQFSILCLLLTSGATILAPQKHFLTANWAPKPGNGALPIHKTQSRSFPNRSPFRQPKSYHPDSHLRFCTCSSTLCALMLVHEQVLVNSFIKHLFGFVELHKPEIFFLAGFYILVISQQEA